MASPLFTGFCTLYVNLCSSLPTAVPSATDVVLDGMILSGVSVLGAVPLACGLEAARAVYRATALPEPGLMSHLSTLPCAAEAFNASSPRSPALRRKHGLLILPIRITS